MSIRLNDRVVGYQVRTADRRTMIGTVEGYRDRGLRLHKLPGHAGHHGYLPAEAIASSDGATDTIVLKEGITLEQVLDAPPPAQESAEGWHKSSDWWADLLGHYGLFESEGRAGEPMLHPDQR